MEACKKRKKKGRPSLLDLQKRNLKEQSHNNALSNSTPHSSPNYKSATPPRRSTRRNPNPDDEEQQHPITKQTDRQKRTAKKKNPKSPSSSQSQPISDSRSEDPEIATSDHRKRKIGDGSELAGPGKVEKLVSVSESKSNQQGPQVDLGPSTPLPDKKLLLFVLERLQKKDAYSVFSEPVDPEELPDYHEVIEHPMDFSTVKKKLASGAYASLEQFEKDIFLICSNAMQYNAPDTIFFRQARSIQELAKRNFENLRQDSDDENKPEPKVVRRGRPPTKYLKKPIGRSSLERAGSEFTDATLATGGENSISGSAHYDMRKGLHSDKSGFAHGSRNGDSNWLAENRFDWNDEFSGSILRSNSKQGRKEFVLDESRRHTYGQFHFSAGGREPSVLATFSVERKQLMSVGLHSEHGYGRSLARFAANLGPVAWKIASKRIERCLSIGVEFGPGWVGENDILPQRPLTPSISNPNQPLSSQPLSAAEVKSPEKHEENNSSLIMVNKSPEQITENLEASSDGTNGEIKPRPPLQAGQGMNGTNGAYGFNLPAEMEKLIGAGRTIMSSRSSISSHSPKSGPQAVASSRPFQDQKPKSGQSQQQKPKPDLNIRFQSPGSPIPTLTESKHPDLALQL